MDSAERDRGEGGGLSAGGIAGGRGLLPPPHWSGKRPWSGTFGGILLCDQTQDSDSDITLEAVDFTESVGADQVRVYLRHVPPAGERTGRQDLWVPDNGLLGTVRQLQDDTLRGDFTEPIDGAPVEESCKPVDRDDPFSELIFEIHASRRGADIPGFTIQYREDGESHTLKVDWRMFACGTAIPEEAC